MVSIAKRPDGQWRARYRDGSDREHSRHFDRKVDAQRWLDEVTAAVLTGQYVDPKTARTTVGDWCDSWLAGYATRRRSTVRQAEVHWKQIKAAFGSMQLSALRPSHVKSWMVQLKADGAADSYVYALHARLGPVMGDAVHDGILARNPVSRRTSPGAGKQRAYIATTEQVWALHDAFPAYLRGAILLGAFVGLRTAEACGLRVADVDFMRGIVSPVQQYPAQPLKTETSRMAVPIPAELALSLSASVQRWPGEYVITDGKGGQAAPWHLDRAVRATRKKIPGMPEDFRFHDLRHYMASMLIASGADVKVVQARLRHASAKTTLDTYGHLWPDSDESTRTAIAAIVVAPSELLADSLRTGGRSNT